MKSMTPNASPDPMHNYPELRRRLRDRAARKRLADRVTPGLPVDGDPVETRVPAPTVGTLMDGIQDGHLFLYVRTAGQLFALRPKLPKIKKALLPLRAADPNAPKRFTLHLEIHSGAI